MTDISGSCKFVLQLHCSIPWQPVCSVLYADLLLLMHIARKFHGRKGNQHGWTSQCLNRSVYNKFESLLEESCFFSQENSLTSCLWLVSLRFSPPGSQLSSYPLVPLLFSVTPLLSEMLSKTWIWFIKSFLLWLLDVPEPLLQICWTDISM